CYLCRVLQTRHSANANFTVCLRSSTRQKANLPSVFWITLGILPVCRVLDFWHSAKRSVLSNNRVFGSESGRDTGFTNLADFRTSIFIFAFLKQKRVFIFAAGRSSSAKPTVIS